MRHPLKSLVITLIFILLFTSMCSVEAEVNYDVEHIDSDDDVQKIEDEEVSDVTGYDDIDIKSIKSSKQPVKQNV